MYSNQQPYHALGLMSGTSLDGLDIARCAFEQKEHKWFYRILEAETVPYPIELEQRLRGALHLNGLDLMQLHTDYGHYLGKAVLEFKDKHSLSKKILIASHGHTVFHNPNGGFTLQIGSGAAIAAETQDTVVCDFRSLDVALGGQGAPLVPIGDHLLFGDYAYCLNLGGFANISMLQNNSRIAYDICPANFVLNKLVADAKIPIHPQAFEINQNNAFHAYDPDGKIAASGKIHNLLLMQLNALEYYGQTGPRSLGQEWVFEHILPLMDSAQIPLADLLRTYCEHIATQVAATIPEHSYTTKMLATGGGALNGFLMKLLQDVLQQRNMLLVKPDLQLIQFKEALIFAFLGVLRFLNKTNTLASVTGSIRNSIGGAIFNGGN